MDAPLGLPRLHLRTVDSTNARARALAAGGAVHGTLVTATRQHAGRGRQGRKWVAEPGAALLCSLVLRYWDDLLSLRAGLAVCDLVPGGLVKWPNDVLAASGGKVAGVLVEGRPREGWAVLGIGINLGRPPASVAGAGSLGRSDPETVLAELLSSLARRLAEPAEASVTALRERDALRDRPIAWNGGRGVGVGVGPDGTLEVRTGSGEIVRLDAGEVHLER